MSDPQKPILSRISAADLTTDVGEKWVARVKPLLHQPGVTVEARGLSIWVALRYSRNEFMALMLWTGGTEFATAADRDKAMELVGFYSHEHFALAG